MKLSNPANDNVIDRTKKIWQPRSARGLSDEDAREIAENVAGFFSLLAKWANEEVPEPANDNVESSKNPDDEARHDR